MRVKRTCEQCLIPFFRNSGKKIRPFRAPPCTHKRYKLCAVALLPRAFLCAAHAVQTSAPFFRVWQRRDRVFLRGV